MQNSDFIITLAWPEGKILSVGSWYDKVLGLYYKVIKNTNITQAIEYVRNKQSEGEISFGPFYSKCLNCGRFVYQIIEKSTFGSFEKIKVIINDVLLRIPLIKNISILFYFENIKIK